MAEGKMYIYDGQTHDANASLLSTWLSDINDGGSADYFLNFDGYSSYPQNINGVTQAGGLKITRNPTNATVSDITSKMDPESSRYGLYASGDNQEYIFDFSSATINYFSIYLTDMDQAPSAEKNVTVTITFDDNSTETYITDYTKGGTSNDNEFFGIISWDKKIKKVSIKPEKGSEHGYDNLRYGSSSQPSGCFIGVRSVTPPTCSYVSNDIGYYDLSVRVSYQNISSGSTININGTNFTANGSGDQTFVLTNLPITGNGPDYVDVVITTSSCSKTISEAYVKPAWVSFSSYLLSNCYQVSGNDVVDISMTVKYHSTVVDYGYILSGDYSGSSDVNVKTWNVSAVPANGSLFEVFAKVDKYATRACYDTLSLNPSCTPPDSSTICGDVFFDENGNGVFDGTDAYQANIGIEIYEDDNCNGVIDASDALLTTELTGVSGAFSTKVPYISGTQCYTGKIKTSALPSSFILTLPATDTVQIKMKNESRCVLHFAYDTLLVNKLCGKLFEDLNQNTVFDSSDMGLGNVTVKLFRDADCNSSTSGSNDTLIASTLTNSAGDYEFFTQYLGGTQCYKITYDTTQLPSSAIPTSSTKLFVSLSSGGNVNCDNNFTYEKTDCSGLSSITGTVFIDANVDGTMQPNENGQYNVLVNLYEDVNKNGSFDAGTDTFLNSTRTDANGEYAFYPYFNPVQATSDCYMVSSSTDDAEETSSGSMDLTSNQLQVANKWCSMRFQNVAIAKGTTIDSATIKFSAYASDATSISVNIFGEDTANSLTYTSTNGNISVRNLTSNSVSWTPTAWTTDDIHYTPNIGTVLTEILSNSSWSSGNSLSIIMERMGTTDQRQARTYDNSTTLAPELCLYYNQNSEKRYLIIVDSTTMPAGKTMTTSAVQTATFTCKNQVDSLNNFGFKLDTSGINMIIGNVFEDANNNGVNNSGEDSVSNIRIYLYADNNCDGVIDNLATPLDSSITDKDGMFRFYLGNGVLGCFISALDYTTLPPSYTVTTQDTSRFQFSTYGNIKTYPSYGIYTPPLPVTFIFVHASIIQNNGCEVSWATAMEENTQYFEIQRAIESDEFEIVNTIGASFYSTQLTNYSYLDETIPPFAKNISYRICAVDVDGSVMYSNIVYASVSNKNDNIKIWPNPVTDYIMIEPGNKRRGTLEIVDLSGRIIAKYTIENSFNTLDLTSLPTGSYTASFIDNFGNQQTFKFIK
ncbi:MAG: T9SS type A sorting domain-containing protein [Bacteroidia bacterium]